MKAFLIIGGISFYKKEMVWPMLAWPFHIILDIPFHTKDFFPVQFLWPISDIAFDGISWSSPFIVIPNFSGIILLYILRIKEII